jgi:uncharacterized protein YegL
MSNSQLSEIVIVVDESGSMGNIRQDTIGGINTLIEDQKKVADGKANLTIVKFSGQIKPLIQGVDIQVVEPITEKDYSPVGGTALLDAIGKTIDQLEDRYVDLPVSEVPGKVLFIILTDGEENMSKEYTKAQITKMIKHQTNRHGWEFVFAGSNLDSVKEAESIGISSKSAFNFANSSDHVHASYGILSSAATMYRGGNLNADYIGNAVIQDASLSALNIKSESIPSLSVDAVGNVSLNGNLTVKGNVIDTKI